MGLLPRTQPTKLLSNTLEEFNHYSSIRIPPAFSLLCMIVVILHSLTCFLLETLDIMFRIRDLLSIRLDGGLRVTTQLLLPVTFPILLLVQLVILVVVDVGFAVLCVLVCKRRSAPHPSTLSFLEDESGEASKKSWDERPPWSDSLSADRALVMWNGRVLMGVRRSGEALERRAVLVRKDIVEDGGDTIVYFLGFNSAGGDTRPVSW